MTWECFDVSIKDQIAHIVLNRPEKRNSMCTSFWTDLPAIVQDIDHNAKARVIVLSSTGPHFSAGIDLEMLEGVMQVAADIASKPPLAIYGCKRAITYARDHSTADALDHIGIWNASMLIPQQITEAMTAAAKKRVPQFSDLPIID